MEKVNLYVKTTFKGPRRQNGAFMYLLEAEGPRGTATKDETKVIKDATENGANLEAIDEALARIKRPVELVIWTDCEWVAGMIENRWPDRWEMNNWLNAHGKQVTGWEKWSSILSRLRLHAYHIRKGEHHAYSKWMEDKLKKVEVAPVQRKGEQDV